MCSSESKDENLFLTASELGTSGRPLTETRIYMPLQRELMVPENLDKDKDIKLAERKKPSLETITAQKGIQRQKHLISHPPEPHRVCGGDGLRSDVAALSLNSSFLSGRGCQKIIFQGSPNVSCNARANLEVSNGAKGSLC